MPGETIAVMGDWLRGELSFFRDMFHHWVGKMTGILSIILAVAPVVKPHSFEGDAGLIHNRWIWEAAAALSFLIASRMAWDQQRKARLEAESQVHIYKEEIADRHPRLQGKIRLGYLDIGMYYLEDRLLMCEGSCLVTFYLNVVNHSAQDAWMVLPPTLTLTIGGRDYRSEYASLDRCMSTLRANDSELKGDSRIHDLFFGAPGMGVFQKPRPYSGWLMFNLPDSQVHLEGKGDVSGSASITLKDTLGGLHSISTSSIKFRLNKIGITPL